MADSDELIVLLDEWFSEPDDRGEEFWEEYERELEKNPFKI